MKGLRCIKSHLALAMVCLLILVGTSQVTTAQMGTGEGFAVFILYEEGEFWIGSQVNLTIHVFYRGEYVDPDLLELTPGYMSGPLFNVTRIGLGLYRSEVVIEEDHIDRSSYILRAEAELEDGASTWLTNDFLTVPLRVPNMHIRVYPVEPGDVVLSPGEQVDLMIEVFDEHGPTDPDDNYPQVFAYPEELEVSTPVATRVGTGLYTTSFNITDEATGNIQGWVSVRATKTAGPITRYATGSFHVVTDAFTVWTSVTDVTNASAELEMAVMDRQGRGVPEAEVGLWWDYFVVTDTGSSGYRTENGTFTTDHRGHLRLGLDTPASRYNDVMFLGSVTADGISQGFSGHYMLDFPSRPVPGVRVATDYQAPMSPGQDYVIEHTVTKDGEPAAGEEVCVYYEDNRTVLYHGTETTDPQGRFSVTLSLPAGMEPVDPDRNEYITGQLKVLDEYIDTELVWYRVPSRDMEDFEGAQDPDVSLAVGDLHPGRLVTVALDHPVADGELESASVYWSPVSDANWQNCNHDALKRYDRARCSWTGDHYEASFVLPTFVTEDDEVEVVGVIRFNDREEDVLVSGIVEGLRPSVILPDPPSAPRALALEQDLTEVRLAWDPPLDDGGGYVSGYNVYRGEAPDGMTLVGFTDFHTTYVDGSFAMGGTYHYAVAAVNEAGEGPRCDAVAIDTIEYLTPSAPTGLEAVYDQGRVVLGWDPPADDGGQPVTGYVLYRGDAPGSMAEIAELLTGTSFSDPDVERGDHCYYAVAAVNVIGTGAPCEALRVRADYPSPPSPPTDLVATYSNGSIHLAWGPPADDGGEVVTGYVVLRGSSPGELEDLATLGTVASLEDTSLEDGVTYYYQVVAVNELGRGEPSAKVSQLVPQVRPPSPPREVVLTREGNTVVIAWQVPEDDGGSPVIGYRVLRATVGKGAIVEIASVTNATSYVDEGVTEGKTYQYQVVAWNAKREGEPSETASIKVPGSSSESPYGAEWMAVAVAIAALVIHGRDRRRR